MLISQEKSILDNNLARNIFNSSPDAKVVLLIDDPSYTIVHSNKAFVAITGKNESDVVGANLFEVFSVVPIRNSFKVVELLRKSIEAVKTSGNLQKMDVVRMDISTGNSEYFKGRFLELSNTPILNDKNKITHILLSVKDITESCFDSIKPKEFEISQIDSQQRYKSLFLNNPDAVYSFDLAGNFLEANEATAELCETTIEYLLRITFVRLVTEEDRERVYKNFLKACQGEIVKYYTGLLTVKGNHRTLHIINMPIIVNGSIVGVYGIAKDITDIVKSKTALHNNLAKINKILNLSLDVICTIDENGLFVDVSSASFKQWGYHPSELIGTPYTNLVCEEDKEITHAISLKIISGIDTTDFQNRYIHKKGHLIPVTWSAKWDFKSRIMYCIARDGTESLLNKKSLLESEKKYKFLFENNPGAMLIWDFNTLDILDCNEMALSIFGYKKIEFLNLGIKAIRPSDQEAKLQSVLDTLREYQEIHNVDCIHLRKSGEIFYSQINGRLMNLNGIEVVIIQINDVTEREVIKEKVKSERNLLRTLIDNLPDTIYFKDSNAKKVIGNKMDYLFSGASTEYEVLGKTDLEIYGEALGRSWYDQDQKVLQTGKGIYDYEEYFEKSDISKWIATTKIPLKNEYGEVTGLLGIGRNITLQKLAQHQLEKLNEELENYNEKLLKSNMELEQFAYVASHDLQEPLRAISTFLTVLKSQYKDVFDEKGEKYLNFAIEGSLRMRQLIIDLLELSKIGNTEDIIEDVDINQVVEQIKENEIANFKGKSISFLVDNLPIIRASKSGIYQLFSNLISNSVKYSKSESPLEIKISVKSFGLYWQFSVVDNGIGIEPEYFERIFIIFQRLHGKEKYSGTGIGLAIVKKIIENQGGEIWVDSRVGQGSTFYFTIKKN
ncbi:PAS domain S-box protein [Arenibacter sp. BSSL-BM3]|uniref:histidine kinase n=1 Tax=Arenibacter arenosicollis TaxID=2762274 RepID=A0ABR7QQA8_9FLAO|nr:PAS domain-containing sensor histidine kinase [Arenibacter arenosicollis]MBC8769374.1 PAS domain S-box protein [Arenibacter arenosicollis]